MASDAIVRHEDAKILAKETAEQRKRYYDTYYDGRPSLAFVSEIKKQILFRCDWSGLLTAAPSAFVMMGACWAAASQDGAELITLDEIAPKPNGFKYLTNFGGLNLRGALVDGNL